MYIEPNSTLWLFKDIKLDNNYSNTMWFPNSKAQADFFLPKAFAVYNQMSYQRKDRGVIRIEARIADAYSVNYMIFRNICFENKLFFRKLSGWPVSFFAQKETLTLPDIFNGGGIKKIPSG